MKQAQEEPKEMQGGKSAQTLGRSAHGRLREMILTGELPAGTRLQEMAFAQRLGVSRTPVREAIALLISEGKPDSIAAVYQVRVPDPSSRRSDTSTVVAATG